MEYPFFSYNVRGRGAACAGRAG